MHNPQMNTQYLLELSLADAIPVEYDPVRLKTCALVEVDQHLPHHGGQL